MVRQKKDLLQGTLDLLILRIETDLPKDAWEALSTKIEQAVLDSRPVLTKNIEEGSVWPIKVELGNSGSIPLNPRTGKMRRVIDIN